MLDNLKNYINEELVNVINFHCDVNLALTRCYGAVMFASNYAAKEEFNEIVEWWEKEAHPLFLELLRKSL